MTTLSDSISNINDDLRATNLNNFIPTEINRAIEYYQAYAFFFNETSASFNLVADQAYYGVDDGLPDDVLSIDLLQTILSNFTREIKRMPFPYIKRITSPLTAQIPKFYAWFEQKLYFSPQPDQAYTVNMYYKKSYPALVNNNDTNDFLTYASDLIESRAAAILASKKLQDFDLAKELKSSESDALFSLLKITEQYKNPGTVTPVYF